MKTVLITGGSSGIGFELSRYFAKAGYKLLWVSLTDQELNNAKIKLNSEFDNCNVDVLALNLAEANSGKTIYNWTKKNGWNVNVLINNAGFGLFGFFEEMGLDRMKDMIGTNVLALIELSHYFLNDMNKRDEGTIINISSNSSFQPVPKMNIYASTKSFVSHFSRGLHEELKLKGSKINIITVFPAPIKDTAFRKVNDMDNVKTFDGMASTTTSEVAKDIWNGFQKGKNIVVTGAKLRRLYAIKNLVPSKLTQYLVRKEIETT